MKTSDTGRKFIEQFEGCILHAYPDSGGVWTIGYGHTTAAGGPAVHPGQVITKDQADQLLSNDLGKVETEVTNLVKVPLLQNQFDALVSFQYNTGALGRSSILVDINSNKFQAAADAMLAYNHVHGVVVAGLTRRRQAERAMFLNAQLDI